MEKTHIDRCDRLIPGIVKSWPNWDILCGGMADEDMTYEGFRQTTFKECSPLLRIVILDLVEGSEDAPDEVLKNKMGTLLLGIIDDLEKVREGLSLPSEIEIGDTVYISDPSDSKDDFEGIVKDIIGRENPSPAYVVDGGRYGRQPFDRSNIQLVSKCGTIEVRDRVEVDHLMFPPDSIAANSSSSPTFVGEVVDKLWDEDHIVTGYIVKMDVGFIAQYEPKDLRLLSKGASDE
jgi:hypothetical protein